jgi:MFS transporter, DHA1 family, tetracycline resistance protein
MADPSIQTNPASEDLPSPAAGLVEAPLPQPISPASRSAMFIVFIVVFIDLLGFGLVLPLLPLYGDAYISQIIPGGKTSALGGAILGLMMSSFSLMQFLGAPIWGRVSDRIGRRPVLLIGLAGSVVFYSLFGFASELNPETMAVLALTLIFISRFGAGISGATISTAQAVIADVTTPEKRKMGMALIGAAFGIGFTFGPLFGYTALKFFPKHHGSIGFAAAALSLVALILGARLLPETRRPNTSFSHRKWLDMRNIRLALLSPAIGPVILVFFLASLGFGSFESTLSILNRDTLGVVEDQNFLLFAYVGFVLLLTQGLIYRRLARRVSESTFMTAGILLMGVGVLSLGCVSWVAAQKNAEFTQALAPFQRVLGLTGATGWMGDRKVELFWMLLPWLMTSLTLCVAGFALLTPSAQALVSRRTDAEKQGEILGVNQSASAMARILGPLLGLSLYKATTTHLLPYLFGGILLLLMLPLIPRIRRGG